MTTPTTAQSSEAHRRQSHPAETPTTWWGIQWQQRLERQADPKRIARARRLLRAEAVASQQLGPDQVAGSVVMQKAQPVQCHILLAPFSPQAQEHILRTLSEQPATAYQLANRTLPQELDEIMLDFGEPIVPSPAQPLEANCQCPDTQPPCTHTAALYLLAGYRFELNPLLLLQALAIDTHRLALTIGASADEVRSWATPPQPTAPGVSPADSLGASAAQFWGDDPSHFLNLEIPPPQQPAQPAATLQRLGEFPGWQSTMPFLRTMETIYRTNAHHVNDLLRQRGHHSDDTKNRPDAAGIAPELHQPPGTAYHRPADSCEPAPPARHTVEDGHAASQRPNAGKHGPC